MSIESYNLMFSGMGFGICVAMSWWWAAVFFGVLAIGAVYLADWAR